MWRQEGGKVVGILNDWDLARDSSEPRMTITPLERTGTVPFMALDLLDADEETGHLYRHDQEALIWVLAWLFINYDNGKSVKSGKFVEMLREWRTGDHRVCFDRKNSFLTKTLLQKQAQQANTIAAPSWQTLWPLADSLLLNLSALYQARSARLLQARVSGGDQEAAHEEPTDEEVYSSFWRTVRQAVNTKDFQELSDSLQSACLEEGPASPECAQNSLQ